MMDTRERSLFLRFVCGKERLGIGQRAYSTPPFKLQSYSGDGGCVR